jgi:hypothetical protein
MRIENLPLECWPEPRLEKSDLDVRAALLRALIDGDSNARICVSVISEGVLSEAPRALLRAAHRPSVVGRCGCHWWEAGTRQVILPELANTEGGILTFKGIAGSASSACLYVARKKRGDWTVETRCAIF